MSKRQGRPLAALILALGIMGCEQTPDKVKFVPGDSADALPEVTVTNDPATPLDPRQVSAGTKEELPLELLLAPGSQMRLLDGRALTAFYANIFTKRSYGYEFCNVANPANLPAEASACTDSIFSDRESPSMGSFDLNNANGRGAQNVIPAQDLTLNYMKTLRAALARECTVLVAAERANLKAGRQASNKLIKGLAPNAENLNEFFRTLIGVKETGMAVNIGADAYAKAFAQIVAAAADKEKAADQAYLGLCIAISMNPQVIIY